jgi:hypothetical protein
MQLAPPITQSLEQMSSERSNEEVRLQWEEAMGRELGQRAHALSNELTYTNWRWTQYVKLYASGPKKVELLNEAAPLFFRFVQDIFFEETVLSIARLTGPRKSAGQENLSIGGLADLIIDREVRSRVQEKTADARSASEFAVPWRNKRLAHRDLSLSLKLSPPLDSIGIQRVTDSLRAIGVVLNEVQMSFKLGVTAYSSSPLAGDADALLMTMQHGLRRQRDQEACWARGEMHEDDRNPLPKL